MRGAPGGRHMAHWLRVLADTWAYGKAGGPPHMPLGGLARVCRPPSCCVLRIQHTRFAFAAAMAHPLPAMLDRPFCPSLPPSPQLPPSPSPPPPPPAMAECQNFFDDTSWRSCRSTPSVERIPTAEDEPDGHCVDLRLSLSLGALAPKTKQQPIVRPLPVHPHHLDKQRSGVFASTADAASALRGQNDVAMADKTLFSIKDSAFSLPLPSRDQVWQTLQKNGAVFGQGFRQSDGPNPFHDAASPMCSRRSASIQVMKPAKDLSEVVALPIRRSCSNGVPQQSLSRQVSSIESLLERSPEPPTSSSLHHQQEALELQRKKEMQAQKRQEARKRRKSLIEEKLQKKARQHSGLQRLGSKQCVSSDEKSSLVSALSIEGDGMPEAHHKPIDEYKYAQQGDDKKVRRSRNIEKGAHSEEAVQETHPLYMKDGNANMLVQSTVEHASHCSKHMKGGKLDNPTIEYDSACHGSMHANGGKLSMPSSEHYLSSNGSIHKKMMSGEFSHMSHGSMLMEGVNLITPTNDYDHASYGSMQKMMASGCVSAPATDVKVIVDVQAAKDVNKGEGLKSFPSSCSETESTETKEENSSGQNDSSELQSTSQKSATESNHGYVGAAITPSVLPSMAMTSSSMTYPPFPVMSIPYPYPVRGAVPATMPMQVNFPCFIQCPTAAIGENGNANPTPSNSAQPTGPFPLPVSLGSSFYSMPTPDGSHSWYSTTPAGRIPQSSGALVLNSSTSKDRVTVCSEGKWRHGSEKSAFSPLWRTANQVVSEPQPSVRPLNSQVSVSGPQLSPTKTASDKSTDCGQKEKFVNNRNLPIGRQQSRPIAGRLQPFNMGVMDQSVSCSETERPILGSKGLDVRQEMPVESGALRMGNVEIKEEGVKQDEGSSESQLASEHSGPEVSYMQSGMIAKQKSGSLPHLPWVTTTGTGPNGKTIGGVMYIANGRQVRLVCSCHGKHMSPAEFVEHSGSTDLSNPERNIVVNSFPFLNQLASTSV